MSDSCMLGAFLEADPRKPEEQATGVLACAMHSSPSLARSILDILSVAETGRVEVDTEVATGHGRDRVDVQIRVVGARRDLRRRVWIEAKVNSLLSNDREGQLVRYRGAVADRDEEHGGVKPSLLALLVPRVDEQHERAQIEAADATVLYWQQVGDLAASQGRHLAGHDWRSAARRSDAVLELANLETLVWFLESATRLDSTGKRRKIVGISITDPIRGDLLDCYASSYRAVGTVRGLGERVARRLEDKGWAVGEEDTTGGDDVALDCVSILFAIKEPVDRWWGNSAAGAAYFSIMPIDDRDLPTIAGPTLWAGVAFDDAREHPPKPGAEWLERADAAGFAIEEDTETASLVAVSKYAPLQAVVGGDTEASDQADRITEWVGQLLTAVDQLGFPG